MTEEKALIETMGWQKNAGAHITASVWCGLSCGFALGSGKIVFAGIEGDEKEVAGHDGACLAASSDPDNLAILTAGDDGRILLTEPNGEQKIIHDEMGRFFDQITAADWGGIAFADGRKIYVSMPDGKLKRYQAESQVGGIAFSPKGRKLAVSRNNGASVYWVGTDRAEPEQYNWDGAHGSIGWSPKGDWLVTSMQENALHVWRTDHKKHGRMGGYPTRIKSFSWAAGGAWLATAGADAAVLWPFKGNDGPIGKGADQLVIPAGSFITQIACHPVSDVVAAGTNEGAVFLIRRSDGAVMPALEKCGSEISTLSWAKKGEALAFGSEEGHYGIVDFRAFVGKVES